MYTKPLILINQYNIVNSNFGKPTNSPYSARRPYRTGQV